MSKNIFVGSLAWGTTSEGLEQAFAQYGVVTSAKVVSDRETGRSKGFGFVEMETGGDEAVRWRIRNTPLPPRSTISLSAPLLSFPLCLLLPFTHVFPPPPLLSR